MTVGCKSDLDPMGRGPTGMVVDTIIIKPGPEGKDAIVTSYYPENNNGDGQLLNAIAASVDRVPYVERAYIDFDLSALPGDADILYAQMKLFADTVVNVAGYTGHSVSGTSGYNTSNAWILEKVISPWEENTVSWFNVPSTSSTSPIELPSSTSFNQAYEVDVTEAITNQFRFKGSSYGFLLKLKEEKSTRKISFCSSDYSYPQLRPQLTIVYR